MFCLSCLYIILNSNRNIFWTVILEAGTGEKSRGGETERAGDSHREEGSGSNLHGKART